MDTVAALIDPFRLLEHPFYRRWESGALEEGELAAYAAQYRHFEAQLPSFLEGLGALVEGEAADLVAANLADERGGPKTHLELFDGFCAAVDAPVAEPTAAMATLIATYNDALSSGDAAYALGVLAGYEIQAAEVADTKGAGLAEHYGVDEKGRTFWLLHAALEADHADWTLRAAEGLDEARFAEGAQASATAWWGFLDEREALVAA
jgi:pyrroloquinoline quinone (PQQ) biosynthesis protein C